MPMKLISLLNEKNKNAFGSSPVTIGFLGDSVTNGCFEVLSALTENGEEGVDVIFDTENSYSADLQKILKRLYPKAQINIINAGISGDSAQGGLARMERDLLPYHPDLTVVCFGLNDCSNGADGLKSYHDSLAMIVRWLKQSGSEVILMTPQPICARVHTQLRGENLRKIAGELVKIFNEGIFDSYMQQMRDVAKEEEVPLCDVYARWMTLYHSGVDITDLLANYLNHPTRDMHWAFAVSLAEIVFA
ncbi:MAG: SGNH/GDSL hydrolase family protein [Roseburia sp.]|nr:SGNH/GDSL hydrolase family protein [Roseburia sp.]